MSTKDQENAWKSLQQPIFDCVTSSAYTNLLKLNENELLMFNGATNNRSTRHFLCKYNIKKNKWTQWLKYPEHLITSYATGSLNNDKSKLYIFGDPGHVFTFELESGKVTKSDQEFYDGTHCRSLFVNEQFHIFGGWSHTAKAHFIWNQQEKNLLEMHKFDEIGHGSLTLHSVMYLSSKNCVLIMPFTSTSIYEYSLTTKQCQLLQFDTTNVDGTWSRALLTADERYIICFGYNQNSQSIYLLDLNTLKISISKIESAVTGFGAACIGSNDYNEEFAIFGYIRQCWKLPEFSDLMELPMDVIRIIKSFIFFEMIYMLDAKHEKFCSISVDKLFDQYVEII